MVKGAMFHIHFLFVTFAVIYWPASADENAVNSYYDMTNGFLDVVQPTARLIGMNNNHNTNIIAYRRIYDAVTGA